MVQRRHRLTALVSVVALALIAAGQPPAPPAQPVEPAGVPVIWEGRELYRVYDSYGPFSPEERARLAVERLERAVRDGLQPEALTIRHQETRSELYVGDRIVGVLTDVDAAGAGQPLQPYAEALLARIRETIAAAEEEQTARGRVIQGSEALGATLLLVAILIGVRAMSRRLRQRIAAVREDRLRLRLHEVELISGERTVRFLTAAVKLAVFAVSALAVVVWFQAVLLVLPLTRGFARAVAGYLLAPLAYVWQALVGLVPNLFFLAVIAGATYLVLKGVRRLFVEVERGRISLGTFQPEWADPTYKLARVLVIALALVAAFPYIPGSSTPAFQGISLFLGVLVSLSSSSAIANVIAGTILTYTDAFRIGDRVRIGETTGDVVRKTLIVTRVMTIKNVVVSIPNSLVMNAAIVNYTRKAREGSLILNTSVTIGYDAPWRRVHELLIAAGRATEGVLADPPPFVLQTGLNDFYVGYELNVYTRDANRMVQIYSDLHASIQDRFNEGGIEIMSPHYTSLRDGNRAAMPETPDGPREEPKAFRVRHAD
jgi:small-conductance mechanosensitive channel